MKRIFTKFWLLLLVVTSAYVSKAQTFTINSQAGLVAAINTLNTSGVASGGANITFAANVALTSELPAIGTTVLNASLNSSDQLIINGAGFTITGNYIGTRTGSLTSGANDAIFTLRGPDYVTFQNLTFAEQATNVTATPSIENAIGGYNLNATTPFDGCQFITVTNCTFNMVKNSALSNSSIYFGSFIHTGTTSLGWAPFATSPGDMHREITVTSNTFNGSLNHVVYRGATTNNGSNVFVNNNTMNNYGAGANTAYGFFATYLNSFEFNNNIVNGASLSQTAISYACFASTNCGGQQKAIGNTITLKSGTLTSGTFGINCTSIGSLTEIKSNTITIGSFPAITTGAITALSMSNSGGVANQLMEMMNNTISGTSGSPMVLPGTTGTIILLQGSASSTAATLSTTRISNNTVQFLTKTNSGTLTVINNPTSVNNFVENNTITNVTITNNSATGSSTFNGIIGSNSAVTSQIYRNNTVRDILITGTSTSTSGTLRGVYSFPISTTTNVELSGNIVRNLSFGTGVHTGVVYGVENRSGVTAVLSNNIISGLNASQASGIVNGIYSTGATTTNIFNNVISNLTTPNVNAAVNNTAINIFGGTTCNVTYNTIYPSSGGPLTSTGAIFGATGISQSSTTALNSNNNIINLQGTPVGTGTFACVRRSAIGTAGTKPANYNPTNNIYFTNPGAQNYIYVEGTTTASLRNGYAISGLTPDPVANIVNDPNFNTSCGLYKAFMLDLGTFSEDNLVTSGTVFAPTGASYAESSATTTTIPASITLDILGVTRSTFPDMGAVEFSGSSTDASGPTIAYTNLVNTICKDNVFLTATITDASGINNATGFKPRMYYKKITEANAIAGNTSSDNGWKYVEVSTVAGNLYTFYVDNTLFNTPLVATDTVQYFVVAQDNSFAGNVSAFVASYSAGYCPTSVDLLNAGFPVSGAIKQYIILADPTSVITNASQTSLCNSGNVVLSLTGNPVTGAFYQWQSSPAGANTWNDIVGANSVTYTAIGVTAATDFRCEISCGDYIWNGGSPTTLGQSTPVTVTVNTPQIATTNGASQCGIGSVTLNATAAGAGVVNWYANPSGGTALALGSNSFTTPTISSTTTYYAVSSEGGLSGLQAGPLNNGQTAGYTLQAGLLFNVFTPMTLQGVHIYPIGTGAGVVNIALKDASGVVQQSIAANVTASASPGVKTFIPLNWNVPIGTGWWLDMPSYSGAITTLIRDPQANIVGGPIATNPSMTIPSVMTITSGRLGATGISTTYYFFYDWIVSTGCESFPRTPVVASVFTPDPITIGAVPAQNCNGAIVPLTVSSTLSNYDVYDWTPTTNLFTDSAATTPYTGGSATTVYAKSTTAGSTTYQLVGFNTTSSCQNVTTTSVNYLPASVTISGNSSLCVSGSTTLSFTPTTSLLSSNIAWLNGAGVISGANAASYTTPVITATDNYSVQISDANNNVCFTTPPYQVLVNNPIISSTAPASRCGTGTVTLGATPIAPATINWYANATGGLPLATNSNTFTTPTISSTTTYYAAATDGGATAQVPGGVTWNQYTTVGAFQTSSIASASMIFDAIQPLTIATLDIYPNQAIGTPFTIEVRQTNSSGALIASYSGVTTVQNTTTPTIAQTVPVNLVIPTGTGYIIGFSATSGQTNPGCWRGNITNFPFPFTSPGYINIVASSFGTTTPTLIYQYYFYNWNIATGCESARVPVTATVAPPPPLTVSGTSTKQCANTIVPLSISSTVIDYDSYIWSPITNLYTDPAGLNAYTGTSEAIVYLKSNVAGINTYTVTASNSTTSCANTASTSVEYLPGNLAVTGNNNICLTGAVTLAYAPTTSVASVNIQWNDALGAISGSNGATYTTPTLTASTFYNITLTDDANNICYTTSNYTVNVNNPTLTGTTPGTRCGTGTVQLQATAASPSSTIRWFDGNTPTASLVGTGSPFTTPSISSTTTYYAAASDLGGVASGGRLATQTAGNALGGVPRGVTLVATAPTEIQSFGILASGPAATITVQLYSGANTNTPIGSAATFNIPANAGTATVPVLIEFPCSFPIPAAGTYRLFVTAASAGSPLYYEFSGVTGYPYTIGSDLSLTGSVTSFTSANSLTTYYYFYKITAQSACVSALQAVTATVDPAPSITVSPSSSVCLNSSTTLTATSSNDPNYTYTWMPGNLVGNSIAVSPSTTTVYTVTANDNTAGPFAGCQNFGNTTTTVLPVPSALSIANSVPTACPGTLTNLAATGGTIGGVYTVGDSSTTTSISGITPFTSFWEGARVQYIVRASELNALGVSAGNINSLAFNVTSVPVVSTVFPQVGYTIKMAHTNDAQFVGPTTTGVFATPTAPFQTVFGPVTQGQPTLGWNTFNFGATPFVWDGISNIIVDICHENDNTNTCSGCYMTSSQVSAHTTTWNSAYGRYNDDAAACNIGTQTSAVSSCLTRPDIRFNSASPTNLTWSPVTSLFTDILGLNSYAANTPATSVFANPSATTVYAVTATAANGCTSSATTSVFRDPCNNVVSITALIEGYLDASASPTILMKPVKFNQSVSASLTECDDITVELYASPYTIGDPAVATSTALLSISGTGTATFSPPVVAGNYYVRLVHRTAVPTWSAAPVAIAATGSVDFTVAGAIAGGNGYDIDGGTTFAMFSGDIAPNDGSVDNNDFSLWEADANDFLAGYLATDLNGDGSTENNDFTLWETNSNNFVAEVTP